MKKTSVVWFLALAAAAVATWPAGAQVEEGPAPARRFLRLLAASTDAGPASTTLADMPDMTANFVLRSRDGACVTATFSGAFIQGVVGEADGSVTLRALIDGGLMEGHNVAGILGEPLRAGANVFRSYTFWKCGLVEGPHTISIQWRSHLTSPGLVTRARTLVVQGG